MSGKLTTDESAKKSNILSATPQRQQQLSSTPMAVEHPNLTVGFIGAGNMATAMAKGFLKTNLVLPNQLIASAKIIILFQAFWFGERN